MPSHTAHSALIKLYYVPGYPGAPWIWPQWQSITGIRHGLFPTDDKLLPHNWTREDSNQVKSFFTQYNNVATEDSKIKFCAQVKAGPHRIGGEIWLKLIRSHWEKWHIHDTIVDAFRQQGIHPINIMLKNPDNWPQSDMYIPMATDVIGMALFGEEAFDGNELLPADLRKCVQILAQCSWARIRVRVLTDKGKLNNLEGLALEAFQALDQEGATRASLVRTLRAVSRWRNLASSYGTDENLQKADEMLSAVEKLLENCGARIQKKSVQLVREESKEKLFKVNPTPVKSLATEADILYLQSLYEEYFNDISDGVDILATGSSTLPTELGDTEPGDLGMEVEQRLSFDDISHQLGFSKTGLPMQFNKFRHMAGLTPWEKDHTSIFKDASAPHIVPNRLHWHQLAGVHSFARTVFTGEANPQACTGYLISDEVGLGKTAQLISMIAFLNQCITTQERKASHPQDFPPVLAERRFLAGRDSVQSLPHLIVVPGTLQNQWIRELQTLFRPQSIDILVYENPKPKSPSFWGPEGPFGLSKQKPHNKIIITTHSCLQNQMSKAYASKPKAGKQPWELPARKGLNSLDNTLFGQHFLSVSVDEIHQMRNAGSKHYGVLCIYKQALVKIGLTGTPLLTGPKDISALGRLLGVPYFLTQQSIDDEKEDNSTIRRAKKWDDDGQGLRKAQLTAVRRMQSQFMGYILRRTTTSVSWEGKPLILLPEPVEIIGVMSLTDREKKIIQERAEEARAMVMSSNETGQLRTRKFYHEYRTAVSYAQENADDPLPVFKTVDEWNPRKSTKMDVCARVCQHYLSGDDVPDVTFVDGNLVLPGVNLASVERQQQRKILIYSESPSVTVLLKNVLQLYGIPSLSIDGSQTFDKRDKIVEHYYQPSSPRILIFSSVGAAGLNLSIADIVVFFNQVWSYQDAVQIFARAYRQPQKKRVRAIHLLAAESSDLLLNAIALRKKDMFSGFVNKELGQELSNLLSGHVVCRPEENVEMDPHLLFDNLAKEEENKKEGSEKLSKKSTRKRKSQKAKEEGITPAASSAIQGLNSSTTVQATDAPSTTVQVTDAPSMTEQVTDAPSMTEQGTDVPLQATDVPLTTVQATNVPSTMVQATGEVQNGDGEFPTNLADAENTAKAWDELTDYDSSMVISDRDAQDLTDMQGLSEMTTEPDDSSDGASMKDISGRYESDSEDVMHHDRIHSQVPGMEEGIIVNNRGARRRLSSPEPLNSSPCPKRPRTDPAPSPIVGESKETGNDGSVVQTPETGPQPPQNQPTNLASRPKDAAVAPRIPPPSTSDRSSETGKRYPLNRAGAFIRDKEMPMNPPAPSSSSVPSTAGTGQTNIPEPGGSATQKPPSAHRRANPFLKSKAAGTSLSGMKPPTSMHTDSPAHMIKDREAHMNPPSSSSSVPSTTGTGQTNIPEPGGLSTQKPPSAQQRMASFLKSKAAGNSSSGMKPPMSVYNDGPTHRQPSVIDLDSDVPGPPNKEALRDFIRKREFGKGRLNKRT